MTSAVVGPLSVSVVIPIYQGEHTLAGLVAEISEHFQPRPTPAGFVYVVDEVLLVHDQGPDDSARVIRELTVRYPQVRAIWLSRNFGQHAATLAGMASSGGEWIVTLDEDGQHDPAAIPEFIDVAMREQAQAVYAQPTNAPPHGVMRNLASRGAKRTLKHLMRDGDDVHFQSYRLLLGEVGRSVAAYAGTGIYLDVAIRWVCHRFAVCPVHLRQEGDRPSGYSTRRLLSHYWRLVLSSGTRGLRVVSIIGMAFALVGISLAAYVAVATVLDASTGARGWSSLMVVMCLATGAILFSLGVVAEYVGIAVNMAMGRPLYLITSDPENGPLGRRPVEVEVEARIPQT